MMSFLSFTQHHKKYKHNNQQTNCIWYKVQIVPYQLCQYPTYAFSLSHKTMISLSKAIERKYTILLIQERSDDQDSKPNSFFLNVRAQTAEMALSFEGDETTYFPSKSLFIFWVTNTQEDKNTRCTYMQRRPCDQHVLIKFD